MMKKIFSLLLSQLLLVGALFTTSCSKDDEIHTPIPQEIQTFTVNGVSFNMMLVKAGTFTMGATPEQQDPNRGEKPAHRVTLTHDYYMGETEVTQALWYAVMGSNPSYVKGDHLPVEKVSWYDCQEFVGRLSELTGRVFRLPTEAEWEFAARGGNNSRGYQYAGSNNLDEVAWYCDNRTQHVKSKRPNELGLYDMSGNVFEWCQDWEGDYCSESQTDPTGPGPAADASRRMARGGSFCDGAWYCRVACRVDYSPNDHNFRYGLRLALSE